MFKLGRGGGGGRGGAKRPLHPSPSLAHKTRPVGPSSASRLSIGGPSAGARDRAGAGGSGTGGPVQAVAEETFSMVSRNQLDFAAIIRLVPHLVDEIRRAEERGGAVRIRFDSNSNDVSGNVVDVDGKEFRFTWSRDVGDLCDTYEELRSGEDGEGLLVERGSAWRKLDVQRVLDESIKNHVKMRSEQAERLLRSRKAIVLDPANPSVKNQSSAAVEGSMRRMHWNKKKEHLYNKKQKHEPNQGTNLGSSKSSIKPVPPLKHSRGRQSVSPLPSPPVKPVSTSPYGAANLFRGLVTTDAVNLGISNKEDIHNSDKEINEKVVRVLPNKVAGSKGANSQPTDLWSMLVTLLSDNPRGMSFKALEKAVGDVMPSSAKKIESVLKSIANYQAPGRYILKTGVAMENLKRPLSEIGSSPESTRDARRVVEVVEKITTDDVEPQVNIDSVEEEGGALDKIEILKNSPDPFTNNIMATTDHEERQGSSTESGSDSDSDSDSSGSESDSDNGSQSRSRSKSRSPADSGSASSSGSDSDGSSSSKETDVEVDITSSDDDKEEVNNKSLAATLNSSPSPRTWRGYAKPYEQNDMDEGRQDDLVPSPHLGSPVPEKDDDMALTAEGTEAKTSKTSETEILVEDVVIGEHRTSPKNLDQKLPSLSHNQKVPEREQACYDGGRANNGGKKNDFPGSGRPHINDSSEYEHLDISGKTSKSKSKSRRPSENNNNNIHEKVESSKKSKITTSAKSMGYRNESNILEVSPNAPGILEQKQYQDSMKMATSSISREVADDLQKDSCSAGYERSMSYGSINKKRPSPDFHKVLSLDAQESSRRPGDVNARKKPFGIEKSGRSTENFDRGAKHDERLPAYPEPGLLALRNTPLKDKFSLQKDKYSKDTRDDNLDSNEKCSAGSFRGSDAGERHSFLPDTNYVKSGEQSRIRKDDVRVSNLQKEDAAKGASVNEKESILRRELSDLELGEFREPSSLEDSQESRRKLDRKGSFKSSENKLNGNEKFQPDAGKGKNSAEVSNETKPQSPFSEGRTCYSQEGFPRKISEGSSRSLQRAKMEQADPDIPSHIDIFPETIQNEESRENQWMIGAENHTTTSSKVPAGRLDPTETGSRICSESKQQKNDELRGSNDWRKSNFRKDIGRMWSSEEDTTFFSKFEKEEPEFRDPIKNFSQYKVYVQEYKEKYECYVALNEVMEKTRAEFMKIGGDLPELAKGRDKKEYHYCCQKIREFCHQHNMRDCRIKKTFVVLHEELTTLKQRIKDFAIEYSGE